MRGVIAALGGQRVLAFAGIGDPQKFFATLPRPASRLRRDAAFPDHHCYSRAEALLWVDATARGNWQLVTTEKDLARLDGTRGQRSSPRMQARCGRSPST